MSDESNTRDVVARRILHYFLEHPAAADSVAGIRHWWLRDEGELNEAVVTDVLDTMTKRGWLLARGGKPETRVYAFNERTRNDAVRFIENIGERLNG